LYNIYARNRGFDVRRKGIDKLRRHPHEVIYRKFCFNKEGVKKLCDKRQDGLTVNRRIDNIVECPDEMHVRLRLLTHQRFWVVTKFVNSHSHDLSSSNKVHHFYSHQTHRLKISRRIMTTHQSKISRRIMTNLIDVGICPLNISRIVNAMNHRESCEEVSPQQIIDFIRHRRNNIGYEFISIIKYF